jgi:heterogeneous nuclear ribonucleoprotein K
MKRESDGDSNVADNPAMKRVKSGECEVRLLIPSKAAGSVIGKGGNNITRLRKDYNATISIPDCLGPERVMSISADEEDILNVLREAIPALDEIVCRLKSSNSRGTEVRMLIHHLQAGAIIGKGGSQIKELREETGANIKIYGENCPHSTDRVLQIAGDPDTIVRCVQKCLSLLKSATPRGNAQPYDSNNYDEFYANDYGGWGDPSRAMPRGGGGPMAGGPMGGMPPRPPGPGGIGPRGPMPQMGARGGPFGGPMGGMGGMGPRGEFGKPKSLLGGMNGPQEETSSQQVSIPKDLAGAIIGKGGARIRKIRNDSGAGITIEDAAPGAEERIITINGTPVQIQMAQYLLQQSVRQNSNYGRK